MPLVHVCLRHLTSLPLNPQPFTHAHLLRLQLCSTLIISRCDPWQVQSRLKLLYEILCPPQAIKPIES